MTQWIRLAGEWVAGSMAFAVACYAAYAAIRWLQYGRVAAPTRADEADLLLDPCMPRYEVAERHCVRVAAPPEATFAAASALNLRQSRLVRAIFRIRQLLLRGNRQEKSDAPGSFIEEIRALGWRVLAEIPGRETIFGTVTQPWVPDVVFRALSSEEFAKFDEAGYVKIAWTMRTDPAGPGESIFRSETRAVTTDPLGQRKFRRYWSVFSPGILLIRIIAIRLVKREAERWVVEHQNARRVSEPSLPAKG